MAARFAFPLIALALASCARDGTTAGGPAGQGDRALVQLVCGPEGPARNPDPPTPAVMGPSCHRSGWDAEHGRYRAFCEGDRTNPSPADPWLWPYRERGDSLVEAQLALALDRNSRCP